MRIIIAYTAAITFAVICYHYEVTNAQDCETERHLFMTSENSSVNCSSAFSRVVDLVIARNDLFSISDLNMVCGTGSNNAHVCESGITDYFTACRSFEVVRPHVCIANYVHVMQVQQLVQAGKNSTSQH